MFYRSFEPLHGPLAPVVERVWACEVEGARGEELKLPTGRSQLIFGLDPLHPIAAMQGPSTKVAVIDAAPQRLAIGVVMRAGGLRALTGESTSLFTDRYADAGDALDIDVDDVIEDLRVALSQRRVLPVLERLIGGRVASIGRPPSDRVHMAVGLLRSGLSVSATCEKAGLNRPVLASDFRSQVGMNPKLYSRLVRFESSVVRVRSAKSVGLAAVATEFGYADQAHMTREFTKFAGVTPSALHRDESSSPNHVRR